MRSWWNGVKVCAAVALVIGQVTASGIPAYGAKEAVSQLVTFREAKGRPVKEPHQHSRLGTSFKLGAVGKAIGLSEIGFGFGIDTLWAPNGGVQEYSATMDIVWDFSKKDLNELNGHLAKHELFGNLPLGTIKVATKEVYFRRQLGFSADVGVDVNIKGTWHNNAAKVTVTDLGIDIEDRENEKIGPHTGKGGITGVDTSDAFYHKDTVNVTDLPGLVQSATKAITDYLKKISSDTTLVEKVIDFTAKKALKFALGVIVTQTDYNRKMEFDVAAWATDMDGKSVALNLKEGSRHIVIDDEKKTHALYAELPKDCPPLKEITLSIQNAKYYYSDQGNVEIGIRSDAFYVTTGPMTQGFLDPVHHVIAADHDPQLKLVADQLVFVPCHGRVVCGYPPAPMAGATVTVEAKDKSFRCEDLSDQGGNFFMDFYAPATGGTKGIAYNINADKKGFTGAKTDNTSAHYDGDAIILTIFYPNTFSVSGTVKDARGNGIADAEVFLDGMTSPTVVTDHLGRYQFASAPYTDKKVSVVAQRNGYNFKPVVLTLEPNKKEQALAVDIVAEGAALMGTMKCTFRGASGSTLPGSVEVTKSDNTTMGVTIEKDRTISIPVMDRNAESLTFAKQGYVFDPEKVTATFSGKGMEKKTFTVQVTPVGAQDVDLKLTPKKIETRGGVSFPDYRSEELCEATATVKDARHRPLGGVLVKFEATKGGAAAKFLKDGAVSAIGYATTDGKGKAVISVIADRTGESTITATSLEEIEHDVAGHQVKSDGVKLKSKPSTRGEETGASSSQTAAVEAAQVPPPAVTLTIPSTNGTVNMPLAYSFTANGQANLRNVTLRFGDNVMDLVIDSGLLAGKKSWTGSHNHVYAQQGTYTVSLTATDVNGKTASASRTVTIAPVADLGDVVAPTGAVEINGGAATTSERGVSLYITGSDNPGGNGIYRYRVSNDGTNWPNGWQAVDFANDVPRPTVAIYRAWQLTIGAGQKTVYVQLKDAAGNVSDAITGIITLE